MNFTYKLKKTYYGKYKHHFGYKVYIRDKYIKYVNKKEDAYKLIINELKKELKEVTEMARYPM